MAAVPIGKDMNGRIVVENAERGTRLSVYLPKSGMGDEHVIH